MPRYRDVMFFGVIGNMIAGQLALKMALPRADVITVSDSSILAAEHRNLSRNSFQKSLAIRLGPPASFRFRSSPLASYEAQKSNESERWTPRYSVNARCYVRTGSDPMSTSSGIAVVRGS